MQKPALSAVLITRNAERTIGKCLAGLEFADEIVVLDTNSTDLTVAIARERGARVFRSPLKGFGPTKNAAVGKARGKWILSIDADEFVPPGLKKEIKRVIDSPNPLDAYEIPRRNFYFGKWLRFGGKYPDLQCRLFRKGRAGFTPKHLHEGVRARGRTGRLWHHLDHDAYPTLDEYVRKLKFYSSYEALHLLSSGARPSWPLALSLCFARPLSRFVRRYFLKAGFLDGLPGFLACVHDAMTHILTYAYLAEAAERRRRKGAG